MRLYFLTRTVAQKGILFIMIQKPYDIGDRICFKSQTDPVDEYGPAHGGWIVEKVDLYTYVLFLRVPLCDLDAPKMKCTFPAPFHSSFGSYVHVR